MSTDTMPKGCEGPAYPQWGAAQRIDIEKVDYSGIAEYAEGPSDAPGQDAIGDGDIAAHGGTGDGRARGGVGTEPWHEDGTPEQWGPDTGATTAEYAITTLAACGFAALLVVILKSEPIKELVTGVIETALGLGA
ncbi:DUF4244 domain-containing protein [Brevibacterium marinum]|uniref:DUF4244 domain-containing protein n=1 Tax=Brevibacterium marinum TaxID=418643 RepID=A0A846RW28_9MICO|nr:DUF4244 domain-containing protein [Brevibacterium marinum]NJC58414.1 hypothetical protein [Brevibacterium marinum]